MKFSFLRPISALLFACLMACTAPSGSQESVQPISNNEAAPQTYQPEDSIRDYLLENYFNQPGDTTLVCFDRDAECAGRAIRVRYDAQFDGFIGAGSCTAGNCDYFFFSEVNDFTEPVLEVSGTRLRFEKRNRQLSNITVDIRADPATTYVVKYVYRGREYVPEQCSVVVTKANGSLGSRRDVACEDVDGLL